jgi:hypothetical protein
MKKVKKCINKKCNYTATSPDGVRCQWCYNKRQSKADALFRLLQMKKMEK